MTHPVDEHSVDSPDPIEDAGPTVGDDRLGPLFGSLPPDVLREVLQKLDHHSLGLFALASGACWRAMKDAGKSCKVNKYLLCMYAAGGGHLECLRYAHERGCPWDRYTCSIAASGGHLECLGYLHEHGCPWDGFTCFCAASRGHLECLRYARERGCPWDTRTIMGAATSGHLECLRYAHERGCPLDRRACYFTATRLDSTSRHHSQRRGRLECLRYARDHGCPCPDTYLEL